MAELAFRVKADYEEAIKMRNELNQLHQAIMSVDTSTVEGQKRMQALTAEYARVNGRLQGLVNDASEYALKLKQTAENATKLEDAFKFGRSLEGNRKVVRDFLKDLQSDLNQVKQQIKDTETGIANDRAFKKSLEDKLQDAKTSLEQTNMVLAQYKFSENEYAGHILDPLSRSIREKDKEIENLQANLDKLSSAGDFSSIAQAAIAARNKYDELKGDESNESKNRRSQLLATYNANVNLLNAGVGKTERIGGRDVVVEDAEATMARLQEIASGNVESIRVYVENLQSQIDAAKTELVGLEKAYDAALEEDRANSANDTELKQLQEQAAQAKSNVEALEKQLGDLNNGVGTSGKTEEELENLKDSAGELEAKIRGVQARLKDDDLSKQNIFQGVTQGLQGLMGAYTAASGILAQFGVEEEDLQRIQTKLQASMSILMGMQHVFNALQSESAFRTKVVNGAMISLAKAYQKVAASSALAKLGIAGVVVAAVAGAAVLIASISKFAKSEKETREHINKTSQSAAEQIAAFMQLQQQWKAANGNLEKQNELLNSSKMGQFANQIKDVSDAQDAFVKNSAKYINALIAQAEAEIYLEEAREKAKKGVKAKMEAEEYREKYENASNGITRSYYHRQMLKRREEANQILGGPNSEVGKLLAEAAKVSTKSQTTLGNPTADEAAARNYQIAKMQRDNLRNTRRQIEDAELSTRQMRINLMKDTAAKELAQLNLDYDKEKLTRERQKEDRIKQLQDQQKAIWQKANPNRKEHEFSSNISSLPKAEQDQYNEQGKLAKEQFEKTKKELLDAYGDVNTRRQNIVTAWEETLAPVTDEQVRKILETERDIELANFDYDNIVDNGSVEEVMDKLRKKIQAEAKKIVDENIREAFVAQGLAQVADMAYENAAKYGTRKEQIDTLRNKILANSKTIKDPYDREVFLAQGGVQIAQAQYGNWQDYNTYDKAVEAAQKVYEAKKAELELREDNLGLMNLETRHANDLFNIELKFNKDLSTIFGNVSRYTKEQLANAKAIAQATLKAGKVNGQALTPNQIKDIQEALNGIIDAESELPFRSGNNDLFGMIKNVQILISKQKELAGMTDTTSVAYKKLAEEIEQRKSQLSLDAFATSMGVFSEGLNIATNAISRLATASGSEALAGVAESMEQVGGIMQKTMAGFAAGGPYGAIAGAAIGIGEQVVNAFVGMAEAAAKSINAAEKLHTALRSIALDETLKKDLDSIFGSSFDQRIENARNVLEYTSDIGTRKSLVDSVIQANAESIALQLSGGSPADYLIGTIMGPVLGGIGSALFRQSKDYEDAVNKMEAYREMIGSAQIRTEYSKGFLGIGRSQTFQSLSELAAKENVELFDKNGVVNVDFLRTLSQTYDTLTDDEKSFIDAAITDAEAYRDAIDQVKSSLSSLFSSTSSALADATIEGLHNGATMGAADMKRILSGTAKELQKSMVESIYAKYMSKFEDVMINGIMEKGWTEEDIMYQYSELLNNMGPTIQMAQNAARRMEEMGEAMGFDMSGLQNATPSQASYQTISETTGTAIDGRLTSLQISSGEQTGLLGMMNMSMSQVLEQVNNGVRIADDVRNILNDSYLELVEIRKNTGDNVGELKLVKQMVANIEEHTRRL